MAFAKHHFAMTTILIRLCKEAETCRRLGNSLQALISILEGSATALRESRPTAQMYSALTVTCTSIVV